jgi:hypothetical protein
MESASYYLIFVTRPNLGISEMKKTQIIVFFCIVIATSYASLWYGFTKGYQYRSSRNLVESIVTTKVLTHIRSGENEKAIKQLEDMLDLQIIDRLTTSATDKDFGKYIIGMPKRDVINDQRLKARIIDYRISTNYKCTTLEQVCEVINAYIYDDLESVQTKSWAEGN